MVNTVEVNGKFDNMYAKIIISFKDLKMLIVLFTLKSI